MASARSVPENEGGNVKNECDDPEVNAMALKMKENYQKYARATVTLANTPTTTNNTQQNNREYLHKNCEDIESIKGRFSWELIDGHYVPYIIRVINGEYLKFVSVHIAETQLLSKHSIHYLHADIYTCTSIKSHFMSDSEAKLLNEINHIHSDDKFGEKKFVARKDCIVHLEDVIEFYKFLNACIKKLLCNIYPCGNEKLGFIRINSNLVVPYCTHDSQKYLPMFYFEEETESLKRQAVKLNNWNLAYFKFCLKVQGAINLLSDSDFDTMVSLDCFKNLCKPDTNFEEYWPATTNILFEYNKKSGHVNPSGVWTKAPLEVVPAENTFTSIESAPSTSQSIPVTKNNDLNGCPASQMCSAISQGSSSINDAGYNVPPPPLVHADNTAPVIGNTVSSSNVVPISQCVTTIYSPMTNSNVMSHSSQMRQLNTQSSNNTQAQQQQLQQQQITTNPYIEWEFTKIPERTCTHDASNNDPYKIIAATLQNKKVFCINFNPYEYSDLMVTLNDLVEVTLPESTVATCIYVLREYLKKTLFSGNSEQLAVLRENGRLRSMHPDDTPMVRLKDVKYEFSQLKSLVKLGFQEENMQQYLSAGPSKRQRTI